MIFKFLKSTKLHISLKKYLLCVILFFYILTNLFAQKFTEYEVKAVFLVNFGKFVQWPEYKSKRDSIFVLGIYGSNPFSDIFKNPSFQKVKINDRRYIVKQYNDIARINCDMLFITDIDKYDMIQIINHTKDKTILTIGDNLDEFCEKGGMINFTEKGNRYRFEINNDAALYSKIKISSKLLNLAKIIKVDEVKF